MSPDELAFPTTRNAPAGLQILSKEQEIVPGATFCPLGTCSWPPPEPHLAEPRPPPPSSARASATMRANRASATGPELRLRIALNSIGVGGYRANPRDIIGKPDLTFKHCRLAVFVNGCFWHHHKCRSASSSLPKANTRYWEAKFKANIERDRRKIAQLSAGGWRTVTVWECEIDSDVLAVAKRVASILDAPGDHRPVAPS
jgi:DNA mismatch endonuclease, patch repair protein